MKDSPLRLFDDLPIRRKLVLVTMSACLVSLGLACAALFWFQWMQFRKGFAAEVTSVAGALAQNGVAPLTFQDKASAAEVLAMVRLQPYITYACILDAKGQPFAHFGDGNDNDAIALSANHPKLVFADGYVSLAVPVIDGSTQLGTVHLRARYKDKQWQLMRVYGGVMAAVLAGSLLVILSLSSLMKRLIADPIVTLAQVAELISHQDDYTQRAPELGSDEVGRLTRTFNRMLDQIQSRDARLRESQLRYEVAVMGSSDGLWDWNLESNEVYFSPRWKSIIGYADGELTNALGTLHSLIDPQDLAAVLNRTEAYLKGNETAYEIEFRLRHKNGGTRWILSRGAALRDSLGKPIRFAGSHTDITERKQAENQLRLSREKFETLVNSIEGIVWEAELPWASCTFVSEQAERLLGFPAERWLNEPSFWVNHIHSVDRDAAMRHYSEAKTLGKVLRCEYRMITSDEREVWMRDVAAVVAGPTGELLLRGVLFDISEQKKAEREKEQLNRQLQDASREAGMAEVATGVLHNVGNVLNSVNVSNTLIHERLQKSEVATLLRVGGLLQTHASHFDAFLTTDPKGKLVPGFVVQLAEQIGREHEALLCEHEQLSRNIEHIKEIVAMQQSYARVSGLLEQIPIGQLVDDALQMNSAGLARHGVQVARHYGEVPLATVDKHKVLQILVNLIHNAKYALDSSTAAPKQLTVAIALVNDHAYRISVTDNGIGIPAENLTKIFSHGFTTRKDGHGFGLHSGANAAKEMGGVLTAQSQGLGKGATFILELPLHPPKAKR